MTVQDFVNKAIQQDKRNVFEKTTMALDNIIPYELKDFYMEANPVDVEIVVNENTVKFYPLKEVLILQDDYDLDSNCFIFATCNGDPIFLCDNKVYTCCHGVKRAEKEFISDSFEAFLDLID